MKTVDRFIRAQNWKFTWRSSLAATLLLIASAAQAGQEYPAGDLIVGRHMPLGTPSQGRSYLVAAEYSNVTNFLGQGFVNGGAALQGTNTITQLVADDITPSGSNAGMDVVEITFSVANFNSVAVSARARVRFWFDNSGVPGAYYNLPANVGFTFNPLSFSPGVTLVTGTLGPGLFALPGTKFWAGITFDDNNGTTGATLAQMNGLGQGFFDPPDIGSSEDLAFLTDAAGSFFGVSDPSGTPFNFGGSPVANFGWEFMADESTPAAKSSWGRIKNLYR